MGAAPTSRSRTAAGWSPGRRGRAFELPRSGLWTRADPDGPWQLQFLLAERKGDFSWYRRDLGIRLPVGEIGLRSTTGIPYLRPELVLLFKSTHHRDEDEIDFDAVLPSLDRAARSHLLKMAAGR